MNLLSDPGIHRHSFKFTAGCLVSPYFPRWTLWFGKNEHSSIAPRPVPICCPCGRKTSVPVPWGPGSSPLCKGTASSVVARCGTLHDVGCVAWVWCGPQDGPPKLTFVLSSGSTALDTVSGGTMLWIWEVSMGWSPSLPKLASPCRGLLSFLQRHQEHHPNCPSSAPALRSWDNILPGLASKCTAGCVVLGYCGEEGCLSTSTKWLCLSSRHSGLQSLPRRKSCSAIYDPPLNLPFLWLNPQALKCAVYWHLYSTFHTLPLKAFYKAMNYIPVTHWIHSSKKEAFIMRSAMSLVTVPATEFVYVCTRGKVTLIPSLLLMQQEQGRGGTRKGRINDGGRVWSFFIPRCGDVAYINFFKRLQLQGSNDVSGKVPPSLSIGEIIKQ